MASARKMSAWIASILLFYPSGVSAQHQVVCSGEAAGAYAAFPDICRLTNGDLFCVFYSGYGHVSTPSTKWPKGGRIMAVRSSDNGQNWTDPVVIVDTNQDDRDPSVACLKDGTLLINWFTLEQGQVAILLARSTDNGRTWSEPIKLNPDSPYMFACSAPVRELADGSLIIGLYQEDDKKTSAFGATIKSYDGGKTWKDLALIGEMSGVFLDAETDVVTLNGGKLMAALRSSKVDMHFAKSEDGGKSWGPVHSFGFKGHCPYFLRHSSGVILLAHRVPATSLHWTNDEGKTWQGPVQIDTVVGAYPSMVELPDGLVYCVYYEEGKGSSIRGVRLRVDPMGVSIVGSSPKTIASESKLPAYCLIHCRSGKKMTLTQVADDLAARDIVYFGETHDNLAGHRVYAELGKLLANRRPDFVLSMEMFERDVQGVMNDYLRGRIDEATFLKYSRPWKEYARDYRPLIELTRERKLDVIAGNLPRSVAAKIAGKDEFASPFLPRVTTAPLDRYWELFAETMKGHPGADGAVERMYRAQCAKDDAMAERIADYLATNPHRQPLVIHCNGNFHSDYGLGTAARVAQRVPLAQAGVVSMMEVSDVAQADVTNDRRKAHYLLIVTAPPKAAATVKQPEKTGAKNPP